MPWYPILISSLFLIACTPRVQGLQGVADKTYPVVWIIKADQAAKSEKVTVKRAEQIGDLLALEISYAGGCEMHSFELQVLGKHKPTYPPELFVKLYHNSNGDRCRGMIDDRIYFDITSLQLDNTNRINLVLEDQQLTQTYDY